jgi:hypothetical protein
VPKPEGLSAVGIRLFRLLSVLRLLWRLLPEYLFCSPTKDKAVLAANEQLLASFNKSQDEVKPTTRVGGADHRLCSAHATNLPRPEMAGAFWPKRTTFWRQWTNLWTGAERLSGR